MQTLTSRQIRKTPEGDKIHIAASRMLNSNGIGTIDVTVQVGKSMHDRQAINLNFGGDEATALAVADAIVGVLCEVKLAKLELPVEKP